MWNDLYADEHREFPNSEWLALTVFAAVTQVQSLAGELRSHRLHSTAKKEEDMKYR